MYNMYIPLCGLVINIILLIIYRLKVTNLRKENKIYFNMISDAFVLTFFCLIAVYLIYINYDTNLILLANRIECIAIVNYFANLLLYVFYLTKIDNKKNKKIFNIVNITLTLLVLFMPLELKVTNDLNYMVTVGPAIVVTSIAAALALICIFYISLKYKKQLEGKLVPIVCLLIFFLIVLITRSIVPEFICLEFFANIALLLMMFTIENPDLKMIQELEEAKTRADNANKAKSDFLSSMSHEIRTPLNAIVGLSEDMKDRDVCPDIMKEDLNDIIDASHTLLEIVGNIMDINKIESEKMEIVEVSYNFKEEISSLARVQSIRIKDKKIDYKINISDDIPYELIGDKQHVKEIINNLLSNAIKYTDEGIVAMNITCFNNNDICNLEIEVYDTGRGIKKEDLKRLYNKFDRLDVEKNSTIEGTGLGLAITKKLVELLNGTINVESEYGKGTKFNVIIPQKIGNNTSKEEQVITNKIIDYSDKKILIVDDNKLNIKVAKRNIEDLNFKEIDECYNGLECLEKIKSGKKYDIILMDIMMPTMDGEQVLKELKNIKDFDTPVIALTADAIAGSDEKYKNEGFVDYVSKPFNKDTIKLKIDSIFEKDN
ncbi:MAG: ATP-binding protein [Bacilli bacterium]|nr:ATP-binding protein [Bacilli bacterium]